MLDSIKLSIFSKVPGCNSYYWYREGSDSEKECGKHIVVDSILTEEELEVKIKRGNYGRHQAKKDYRNARAL